MNSFISSMQRNGFLRNVGPAVDALIKCKFMSYNCANDHGIRILRHHRMLLHRLSTKIEASNLAVVKTENTHLFKGMRIYWQVNINVICLPRSFVRFFM